MEMIEKLSGQCHRRRVPDDEGRGHEDEGSIVRAQVMVVMTVVMMVSSVMLLYYRRSSKHQIHCDGAGDE